jgi:hypothetical protein
MTKPEPQAAVDIADEAIPCFFNAEQEPQDLSLDGQWLDQMEGESPASGKLDILRGRPRPGRFPRAAFSKNAGGMNVHSFAIQDHGRDCQSQITRLVWSGELSCQHPAHDLGSIGGQSLSLDYDRFVQYRLKLVSQTRLSARQWRLKLNDDGRPGRDGTGSECLRGRHSVTVGEIAKGRALDVLLRRERLRLT